MIHPAGRSSGRAVGPGRNELGNQVAMNRFSEGSEPGNRGCGTSSWVGWNRVTGEDRISGWGFEPASAGERTDKGNRPPALALTGDDIESSYRLTPAGRPVVDHEPKPAET
jgi:hypothetical protein